MVLVTWLGTVSHRDIAWYKRRFVELLVGNQFSVYANASARSMIYPFVVFVVTSSWSVALRNSLWRPMQSRYQPHYLAFGV